MLSGNIDEAPRAAVGDELCHGGRSKPEEYGTKNAKKGWFKKEIIANPACAAE